MMKLLPFALVAVLGSAGLASTENAFSTPMVQPRDNIVHLGTVTTDGPGLVQIYSYHDEKKGNLLGSHDLMAGANEDVTVSLTGTADKKAIAVLLVDGRLVTTQPVMFEAP